MTHLRRIEVAFQNAFARAKDEHGAALAEYGLLLALVALAAVAILFTFGQTLDGVFNDANDELNNRPGG